MRCFKFSFSWCLFWENAVSKSTLCPYSFSSNGKETQSKICKQKSTAKMRKRNNNTFSPIPKQTFQSFYLDRVIEKYRGRSVTVATEEFMYYWKRMYNMLLTITVLLNWPALSRRGGVSYISKRYSKVNNKHLKSYDPRQESKHTIYLDKNNLYGYTMFKFVPTGVGTNLKVSFKYIQQ